MSLHKFRFSVLTPKLFFSVLRMPNRPQDERSHDRNAQQRPYTAHIPSDADGRFCQNAHHKGVNNCNNSVPSSPAKLAI